MFPLHWDKTCMVLSTELGKYSFLLYSLSNPSAYILLTTITVTTLAKVIFISSMEYGHNVNWSPQLHFHACPPTVQNNISKTQIRWITSLFKTLYWFSNISKLKSKVPTMICKALHDLGNVYFSECLSYYSPFHSLYLSHTDLATQWTHGSDLASNVALVSIVPIFIEIHLVHFFLSFRPKMLTTQSFPLPNLSQKSLTNFTKNDGLM